MAQLYLPTFTRPQQQNVLNDIWVYFNKKYTEPLTTCVIKFFVVAENDVATAKKIALRRYDL
jgi:hypothetical protein